MRLARGVVAAISLTACAPSPEALERGRVLVAIDRVRDAPAGEITGRRQLIADLEHTAAMVPDVVRARDTCVTAYRLLIDGTEMQSQVRAELDKGEPSSTLVVRLLEAESRIKVKTVADPCYYGPPCSTRSPKAFARPAIASPGSPSSPTATSTPRSAKSA